MPTAYKRTWLLYASLMGCGIWLEESTVTTHTAFRPVTMQTPNTGFFCMTTDHFLSDLQTTDAHFSNVSISKDQAKNDDR